MIYYFLYFSFFIQNKSSKLFPSDFFEPILPKQEKKSSSIKTNRSPKSIYVSLQKEYEEDRELLDLLSTKRNL